MITEEEICHQNINFLDLLHPIVHRPAYPHGPGRAACPEVFVFECRKCWEEELLAAHPIYLRQLCITTALTVLTPLRKILQPFSLFTLRNIFSWSLLVSSQRTETPARSPSGRRVTRTRSSTRSSPSRRRSSTSSPIPKKATRFASRSLTNSYKIIMCVVRQMQTKG